MRSKSKLKAETQCHYPTGNDSVSITYGKDLTPPLTPFLPPAQNVTGNGPTYAARRATYGRVTVLGQD